MNLAVQNSTHLLAYSSVGQKSGQLSGALCLESQEVKIKVLARLGSCFLALRKNLLTTSFGLLVEFGILGLGSPFPCWLSSRGHCLLLEATHTPSHMVSFIFKASNGTCCPSLPVSLTSSSATHQMKSSA